MTLNHDSDIQHLHGVVRTKKNPLDLDKRTKVDKYIMAKKIKINIYSGCMTVSNIFIWICFGGLKLIKYRLFNYTVNDIKHTLQLNNQWYTMI